MTSRHGGARAVLAAALLLIAGCAGEEAERGSPSGAQDCSIVSQNDQILHLMKDAYLWYQEVPDVDPAAYGSPEAILDALVYKTMDRWSYVTKKSDSDAYYNDGIRVGLGLRLRHDPDNVVKIGLVSPGSPASDAALLRGDVITAISGIATADIDAGGLWDTILGEDVDGVAVTLTVARQGGAPSDVTLVKRPFTLTSTPVREVIHADSGLAFGYLFLDRFITPTAGDLQSAFRAFQDEGATDLILDLRYNGGGLIDVAAQLGGLIGGAITDGRTLNQLVYNDKHDAWNQAQLLTDSPDALDLPRVIVITSPSTASASELLINGLGPLLHVTRIGSTTYGKPVGMNAWTICDQIVRPISFRMVNADGEGDYYDGLAPDCAADDGLSVALGDPAEASLAEALHFLENGSCSASPAPPKGAQGGGSHAQERRPSSTAVPLRGLRGEIDVF